MAKQTTEKVDEIDYKQRSLELELLLQAARERNLEYSNTIDALRVQLTLVQNKLEGLSNVAQESAAGA